MDEAPRLWQFRISHFNEKVRWALDFKRWPHRRKTIVPGFHHVPVWWKSRQIALPVLELDGRVLHDSTRIIAEIERLRPDPPLYPADPTLRERALAIEDFYDEQVAPDVRSLFWWTYLPHRAACVRMSTDGAGPVARAAFRAFFPLARPLFRRQLGAGAANVARARAALGTYLDKLASDLGPSGFLVGDTFSIADLTAAAILTAVIRPPEFSYPLPEPWPEELTELRAGIADHPATRWVLDIYRRHRGTSSEIVERAA